MADTQEAIRRLSIQATTSGVTDATKQLNDLAKAQGGVAVASSSTEKATLSLEQKFASIERRYVSQVRAQQDYEKIQKQVNAAVSQNPALQERANAVLSAAKERHDQLANSQKALGVITGDLNGRVQAAAGSFGVVGQAMSALGPGGIAAAAGIGTLIAGFNIASDAAHALAGKAKELREFAEATGLTTQQVQALKSEAGKFGIDSETLSSGIQKFTTGFQQLRLGTGDLLTQIRRINPALADQIQGAQDAATAFTLFGKAVAQTDNIFQRNALLKAGLGKGSAIFGEFFQTSPDVAGLTAAFTAAGKGLDENLIKKLALLQVEIDKTRGAASTIFATIFAEDVLSAERDFAKVLLDIAKTFKLIADSVPSLSSMPGWFESAAGALARATPGLGTFIRAIDLYKSARGLVAAGAAASDRASGPSFSDRFQPATDNPLKPFSPLPTGQKTPEALAADLKNLVAVLGSAASPSERLSAAIAELGIKAKEAGIGSDSLARGVAGLKLDSAIAVQNAHNAALGQSVTVTDILKAKTLELAKAQQQGAGLTKDQIAFQIQYARETATGITQIKGAIDAENVRSATLTMGTQAAIAYSIVQTKINEAKLRGAPLTEQEVAGLQKTAEAYAKVKVETDRYAEAIQLAKDVGTRFAQDFVQGLLAGKNAMQALTASAAALGRSLTDAGIANIIKDPTSLVGYIEAGVGLVTQLISGKSAADEKAQEELKKAQEQWARMAQQVQAFNAAAAGFDLGPLTNELNGLLNSLGSLVEAARKAHDETGAQQLEGNFLKAAVRITEEFKRGAENLTPLQSAMKALQDEAAGLQESLSSLHLDSLGGQIGPALQIQLEKLVEQFKGTFVDGLYRSINDSRGQGYINDISSAIGELYSNLAQAAQLGGGQFTALSNQAFAEKAQSIIDGAKLAGAGFDALIAQFPILSGVVHQFVDTAVDGSAALEAAQKAAANATEKLNLQMRLLTATTDSSTLAGALTLFDAKAAQERADAAAAGSTNLLLLDQVLAAERANIVKDFGQKAIDAEKQIADARLGQMQRIQEYLDNLRGGSSSTLAPVDRLSAASSSYSTQLGLAKSGDATALGNITSYSQNVLDAARSYYGSSSGYQDIFAQVQRDLQGLIALTGAGAGASATSSSLGSLTGVSSVSVTPVAANTNSWADLKAEIVALGAKVEEQTVALKASSDKGNEIAAEASVQNDKRLDVIATNTGKIGAVTSISLSATR